MIECGELFNTHFSKKSNCYYVAIRINKKTYDYNTSSLQLAKEASDIVKSIHLIENNKTKPIYQCKYCSKNFPSKYKLERHQNGKTECIQRMSTINFINKSKEKFGDSFSYEKTNYVNAVTKVTVNCNCSPNIDILIIPNNHLQKNGGCRKCSKCEIKTYDEIIEIFKLIPENNCIYDHETKQSFTNSSNSMLKIKCPKHGYFNRTIKSHQNNVNCPYCEQEELDKKHKDKLNSIDVNKKKFIHPKYINYSIDINTDKITNLKTNRIMKGNSPNSRGNIDISLSYENKRINISLHRFKYESFYNEIIPDGMDIDHRDGNPRNNCIENLQCLTRLEHGRKTARDNPNRSDKVGKSQGLSGKAYNPITKHTIYFDSLKELKDILHCTLDAIRANILDTEKSPPKGYVVTLEENINQKDEKWEKYNDKPFEVSNMGRIRHNRRITKGSLDCGTSKYYNYSRNKVHKLVMDVFGTPCPGKNYTIDHINIDSLDNRINNLRWATKSQQTLNQRNKIMIKPKKINGYTGEIITEYDSLNHLRKLEGIYSPTLHNTSSIKRDWFINLNPAFLNRDRINFVKGVLEHRKCRSKDICGFSECNTKNKNFYEYKLKPTKFCENKKIFIRRRLKKYPGAYDDIKELAIKHNNARTIQCFFRSYLSFINFFK